MANDRLRVYHGPKGDSNTAAGTAASCTQDPDVVTAPLGDVLTWLADAAIRKRRWLKDFEDDEITISRDLYEVIMAYRHYHRSSA